MWGWPHIQTETDRQRQTETDRQTKADSHRQTDRGKQAETDTETCGAHLANKRNGVLIFAFQFVVVDVRANDRETRCEEVHQTLLHTYIR